MADVRKKEPGSDINLIPIGKIEFFQLTILEWYKKNNRNFYWRKPGLSNYQYIIAEVLLQRTKAETVAKFYLNFLKDFPSWQALVDAEVQKIEDYLKPIGLYRQRSKRLISLAKEMLLRKGRLPRKREDLESIPFMGQYIANAVELIIYNDRSPLLDVNMARVLERYFGERKMVDIRFDPYLQKLAKAVSNHISAKQINWAVLDFAASICKPKPLCAQCVLSVNCCYYNSPS